MIHRFSDRLGTSGAAFVELALVTPVLVVLVLGSADFGRLLYSAQSVAAATRVGAEYARNNPICQQSATGIQMLPTPTINEPCNGNIQTAMQDSRDFNPALTFPDGTQLICYCDLDGAPCLATPEMTASYSCTVNGRGTNQVFIRVSASQAAPAPLLVAVFPPAVTAVTELRLQ